MTTFRLLRQTSRSSRFAQVTVEVAEHGQTRVGLAQSPDTLSTFVGSRLTDGAVIVGHDGDAVCAGLMLRFDTGDLVVGTLGDEWVLAVGSVPAPAAPYWTVQPFVGGSLR